MIAAAFGSMFHAQGLLRREHHEARIMTAAQGGLASPGQLGAVSQ